MGQTVFIASNAAWPTPVDWNNAANWIEGIAGGAGGQDDNGGSGNGGGGGAYGKAINQTLTPSTNNNVTVGAAGAGGTGTGNATAGGATSFVNSSSVTLMSANGGSAGSGASGGAGGTTGTGSTVFAGGPGGGGAGSFGGTGGGGAGGPSGTGGTGGAANGSGSNSAGGGGGGAGGGTAGTIGGTGNPAAGGAGGNNHAGSGSGAGGTTAGTNGTIGTGGGGGGGGGGSNTLFGTGGAGSTEDGTGYTPSWGSSSNGSGSGGGGAAGAALSVTAVTGGAGGSYGGGGGGAGAKTGSPVPNGPAGGPGIVVATWTPSAAGIALGRIASGIFVPGRRQGPARGLRPTQNFSPPPQPPFVFIQDSPRWRSTAAAVLVLANLNTSFVPQPPAPPTLGWLQPLATPQQPAARRYDLNQGWVPQAPSVTPPASIETDSSQPGPVFTKTALYQAFATQPPTAPAPVAVTPPLGWLAPFAVPPQLLRRYDLNTTWVPQPPAPPTLGWLAPFATPSPIARRYDLNQGWVAPPPAGTPTPSTLGWLNPFPAQTAPRPVYDLNQGWVAQVPPAPVVTPPVAWLTPSSDLTYSQTYLYQSLIAPPPQLPAAATITPSTLGWLQPFDVPPRQIVVANTVLAPFALPEIPVLGWFRPFDQPPPKARPQYDLNSGWVPRVPPAVAVTPPSLGWLQPAAVPPRDTLVFDTIIEPFALPAPVISASAEVDIAQPGPVYTRTFIYQSLFAPPQAVGGTAPVISSSLENDSPQPGPIYQRLALYQAFATLPPQPPAVVIPPPPLGWLSSFDLFYGQTYFYQSLVTPPQVPPAITTPSILGWLQPFGIPRQPVRLWDWNTAWPPVPPPPVAITPSALEWLQPFPIPPQPPRRPIFIEFYVPQNVGGTAPPPPTVLQPGGAGVPHTFSRKRWRELQALIAAENAAVAKAERLTKESKREPLLKAARAAAAAIDAADKEGESKRLDALLLRNAESLRKAIRAATDVKRIREAANAIELSNAIVARAIEDEEDEMIQLLLLLS